MNAAINDRRRGALLGLAVGDALGQVVEFRSPGSFVPVTGYREGGPHGLPMGGWTDDSSMALALADSIGAKGWNLNDQMMSYLSWWRDGKFSCVNKCFDIGVTTSSSLRRYESGASIESLKDETNTRAGNGSIMRLAPIPIRYHHLDTDSGVEELLRYAAESSQTTHAAPQCVSACKYMTILMSSCINGTAKEEALSKCAGLVLQKDILAIAKGSYKVKSPPEIVGSGHVVKSLEASMWAFNKGKDFREAVLLAVNLGDDADTTGAVCGQIAGAYYGESGIPKEWLEGLYRKEMVDKALRSLGV